MEHTVKAYIERSSSEQLGMFSKMCAEENKWAQYTSTVPDIFAQLRSRNVCVPEWIQASWETFAEGTSDVQ